MAEVIYQTDPALGPRKIEVKEYAHDDDERGAIHYYEDGKHISGDDFAEYMRPGFKQERQDHLEEHPEENAEWLRRQEEGSLIKTDVDKSNRNYGRLLTEEGKYAHPRGAREKIQKAGDAVVDAAREAGENLVKITKEVKDNAIQAIIANDIERARQILADAGVDLEDVKNGDTAKYEGKPKDKEPEADTEITPPKGEKEKEGVKKESASGNKFAEKNPQVVINLINDLRGRMDKAASEQTVIDLNDKSLREKVEEQQRGKVVDSYIESLPDDQKEEARKQRSQIEEALKMNPEDLESMTGPKREIYLDGEDDVSRYKLRVRGGEVHINRNVDKDGNVIGGDDSWFEFGNGALKGRVNVGQAPESAEESVDSEAMEATMKRLAEIQEELAKDDLTPERRAELNKELAEVIAQQKEVWDKKPDSDTEVISAEEAKENSETRRKKWWERIRDSYKKAKENYNIGLATAVTGDSGEGGDAAAVEVTKKEKIEKDRRRRSRRMLGVLALVGAGTAAYFLGKHGVHVHEFCNGHSTGIGPDHIEHVEHFRGSYGHLRTGVELPGGLHLKHLGTHDIIVNDQGHTIVGHLKEGIADRQGNLSHHAKEILQNHGYRITQNGLEGSDGVFRYMSEVS